MDEFNKPPFSIGNRYDFSRHTFRNEVGGTEFGGAISATVAKTWFDYETGWHAHGVSDDGRTVFLSELDLS